MNMVQFQDMPYVRPDMESLKACTERTTAALKGAATYEDARAAFFALQEAEEAAFTMMSLGSVRNTIDTTDPFYEGEMKWLREQSAGLIPLRKESRRGRDVDDARGSFAVVTGHVWQAHVRYRG